MKVAEQIRLKLTAAFTPLRLDIIDESHRHEGHSGSRPSGETHFRVEIVSSGFEGRSRVERQRLVYAALADEMNNPIHALSIGAYTPAEAAPAPAAETRKN
jgi:BolA protein